MAKGAYIVLTHSFVPNPKSTGDDDEWNVVETCEFVDQIKKRMHSEATAIIDYRNKEVQKNRVNHADYDAYIKYIKETYPTKFEKFRKIVEPGNDRKNET